MNRRELLKSTVAAGMGLAVAPLTTIEAMGKQDSVSDDGILVLDNPSLIECLLQDLNVTKFIIAKYKNNQYRIDTCLRTPLRLSSEDHTVKVFYTLIFYILRTFNSVLIEKILASAALWNVLSTGPERIEIHYDEEGNIEDVLLWAKGESLSSRPFHFY